MLLLKLPLQLVELLSAFLQLLEGSQGLPLVHLARLLQSHQHFVNLLLIQLDLLILRCALLEYALQLQVSLQLLLQCLVLDPDLVSDLAQLSARITHECLSFPLQRLFVLYLLFNYIAP